MLRNYPALRAGGLRNPATRDSEERGWKSSGFLKTWVPRYLNNRIARLHRYAANTLVIFAVAATNSNIAFVTPFWTP